MQKFGRNYKLYVQPTNSSTFIEITYPLTLEFDISRDTSSSINQATFRIYNLSEKNRNAIFKDRYSMLDNGVGTGAKKVILQAGYGDNLSTVFQGSVLEAYSYRQMSEVVTYINALDGGYGIANSFVNFSVSKGTPKQDIFNQLANSILGVDKGSVGTVAGSIDRPIAYNGNGWAFLKRDFSGDVFIDLEKINLLKPNEVINASIPVITSASGLLGTPMRQNTNLTIDMIFEPRIQVGNIVEVKSSINSLFNGQFKTTGIKHSGTISGAINGDCKTTLQLFIGAYLFGGLKKV